MAVATPGDAGEEPLVFDERLVLDTGRAPIPEPTKTSMSFAIRGEYQLRFRVMTDLPLQPRIGTAPGQSDTLGQTTYLYQWMRFRPVYQYRHVLKIVGEIDFPRGIALGDTTQLVGAARDPYDELKWYEVHPRQLYLQYITPIGLVRLGHQTSHWGMGLLANDGDHASLFGDYRRGSIVERLLFATRPMGKGTPLALVLGADVIFEDARADLLDGDRAFQGIAAMRYGTPRFEIGLYAVVRHQERDREAVDELTPFTEDLTVGAIDVAGKFNAPVPGVDAFVYGELEVAFIAGRTNQLRNVDLTAAGEEETIRTFGGAATLGITHVAQTDSGRTWGDVVLAAEWGFASGDADPYDGVTRRFTFDQNHNVGLVLFDQVLAHKTARAATIAQDPAIVNRAAPGLQFLPSEGAVFGAQYLNPTLVVRPRHWLDLKAGAVIAQTTADLVDPFHVGALGDYANYDGGDERRHDLGIELDIGADARLHVSETFVVNSGFEAGVLFPGGALTNASGAKMSNQYLVNSKLGVSY